jgi:hypothetical protein
MNLGTISLGTVALGILFIVVSVGITLAVYYVASGDWLWERGSKSDKRNWSPPR